MFLSFALVLSILPGMAGQTDKPSAGAAPNWSGLRYIYIEPPEGRDGRRDPFGIAEYLETLLSKQGWLFLSGKEDPFASESREMASQAVVCTLELDYAGFGTQAHLRCSDVLGHSFPTVSGKGVAVSEGGELKAAVRDLAKRLQTIRPAFDKTQSVDLLRRLPTIDTSGVTEDGLDKMAAEGRLRFGVEGLWTATDESTSRFGIVAVDGGREFQVVVLESSKTYLWQPGMVRGRLTQAADGQSFAARWRLRNRRETSGVASLNGSTLTIVVSEGGKEQVIRLLKLKPAAVATRRDERPSPAAYTGTGFFCGPGLVATNHHVVDGATAIELHLPEQGVTLPLQLLVSDAANDLAVLRVADQAPEQWPPHLTLLDSGTIRLGTEVVVIGFPLGESLGSGHKVTSGLISALEGMNGDPTKLQITAPIQPGSSGSPVLDTTGRVIAIVTSTMDTLEAIRRAGQAPQNINFAVKADYLALLLKRVFRESSPVPQAGNVGRGTTEVVAKGVPSIGQVRARR